MLQLNRAINNTFRLILHNIPVDLKNYKPLELHLTDLAIPSLTIPQTRIDFGPFYQQMTFDSLEYSDFPVTFNVDESFQNWKILFNWLNFINNNKDSFAENKNDYLVDATLQILDNFLQPVMNIVFESLWLNNLDEITLSYKDGQQELTCGCSFVFDRYYYTEK